jgi:hypothetical protein
LCNLPDIGKRLYEDRRMARHVSNTVAVGIAVDRSDSRSRVGGHGLSGGYPSTDLVQALFALKVAAGQFSFGECADSTGPESGDKPYEDLRGGESIWERPMAPDDLYAEPITKSAQAIACQVRVGQTRERTHIEKSRNLPGKVSARIFTINDGKVIANIVTNDDCIIDAIFERFDDVPEFWRPTQVVAGQAVNLRCRLRNGALRIDELPQRAIRRNLKTSYSQDGDFDDSRGPGVEAGGLSIKRDGLERHQWR